MTVHTEASGFPSLASLVAQYSNVGALVMVGWVLYQTIGVELPALREHTYVRTQAIVNAMEALKTTLETHGRELQETKQFQAELTRLHVEQTKTIAELARELRQLRLPRPDPSATDK